jgi:hypothetical protein
MASRKLENIEGLIKFGGTITIGQIGGLVGASASDEDQCCAMLAMRKRESFSKLLERLDAAVLRAAEHGEFTDEINV